MAFLEGIDFKVIYRCEVRLTAAGTIKITVFDKHKQVGGIVHCINLGALDHALYRLRKMYSLTDENVNINIERKSLCPIVNPVG
jgi:hypothetical protein